ncbi:hypothetical protein L6R52_30910, partial [Myxococcota bacterium]|nr:hypothetical protein [Myxococcota bacterium]
GARSSAGTIASSIPGQGARSSAGTMSAPHDGATSTTNMIGASIASTLGEEPVPSGIGPVLFPPPPELASLLGSLQSSASPSTSGGGSDLGDIPGLLPAGAANDDPFANLDLDGPVLTGAGQSEGTGGGSTPFDDANDRSTYSIAKQGASSQSAQPLARISLEKSASEFSASLATTRVSTALPFPERKAPRLATDGPGGWPTLLGLALGLGVVALAVTGPAGGSLSRFGPETLFALVRPEVSAPLEPLLDSVDVSGAHVTAYATRAGRSLLVVAGDATNDGTDALTEIEAIATIFDGATIVERREALVGVTIPEDVLASVTGPKDLDAAYEAALSDTAPDARTLATGAKRPFMIVFPEVPQDVAERSFVVEFRRANRQPSAPAP